MSTKVEGTQDAKVADAGPPQSEALVKYWLAEIGTARKREQEYRKEAREAEAIYEAQKREEHPYAILYSNTETLSPTLYNQTPRPRVDRRDKREADPVSKAAVDVLQRSLEFVVDTNARDYSSFDELMESAVLSALVPGRGVTRFKYAAAFEKIPTMKEGEKPVERVSYELVCGEEVPWDRVLYGYAKIWRDVPWLSYEHTYTPDEAEEEFGVEIAAKIKYTTSRKDDNGADNEDHWASKESEGVKLATVYEIWDKHKRRVLFISPGLSEGPIKAVADPFGLSGFFPQPRPLQFFRRIRSLTPTTLYAHYEEQAKELNRVTIRINKLITALKARGAFDKRFEGLEGVLAADDNIMVPADSTIAIGEITNLEKSIWMVPIDKIITVLQQLYIQRENIKRIIQELTGLADILRGSSVASETATAQQIKDRWGSIRIRKMQKAVQHYCRDSLRILGEIAGKKLGPQTFMAMTGVQLPTQAQKAQATAVSQELAMKQQPAPQELTMMLQSPTWEEVLALLKDDMLRQYRVDIETNSTVDIDVTEDKKDLSELMAGISQFLNGIGPLVQSGTLPLDAAKAFLLALVRRYRFGADIEDYIRNMQPPKTPDDGKKELETQKLGLEKQKMDFEQKLAIQKQEFEKHKLAFQEKLDMEKAKLQAVNELKIAELRLATELQIAGLKIKADTEVKKADGQRDMALQRERIVSEANTERARIDHEATQAAGEVKKLGQNLIKIVGSGKVSDPGHAEGATQVAQALMMIADKLGRPREITVARDPATNLVTKGTAVLSPTGAAP